MMLPPYIAVHLAKARHREFLDAAARYRLGREARRDVNRLRCQKSVPPIPSTPSPLIDLTIANAGQSLRGWPPTPTLRGRLVALEPLKTEHAAALLPTASDPEVWRWKLTPRPTSLTDMEAIIDGALLAGPDGEPRMAFLARRVADGAVIGSTTLYDLSMTHRCVENGETWLARPYWGQGFNEEMKYLVLAHCFERWGLERVAWRADHLNTRSPNALRRCGFVCEGTLRSHRQRPDGTRRDSVYFSLLSDEWPGVAKHLLELIMSRSVGLHG